MRVVVSAIILLLIAYCLIGFLGDSGLKAKEDNIIAYSVSEKNGHAAAANDRQAADARLPFCKGEQFVYDVYYKKLRIGKSMLTFNGEKKINGRDVYHVTFITRMHGFEDAEDIYADKDTFLPLIVSRRIEKMGSLTTKILEEYDQEAFKIKVTKCSAFLSTEFVIQRDGPIYNAILLPYYYRTKRAFAKDEKFHAILPTTSFDVILRGEEVMTTKLGKISAYVFEGVPSKFTFWLSADEKKIPLKIENHTTWGYTFLINSKKDFT